MELRTVTLPAITREQLRAYADASGDPNPIHLDESVAKRMGLPGVIAHGMLVASFLADRALVAGEEAWHQAAMKHFQVRFRAMTLLGDVLKISATVRESGDGWMALDLAARNQRGETAATAVATVRRA